MRPTQALQVLRYRRQKLTTKDVGRGFYKGNRTGAMGRHTKFGGYVIEWNKVRTYVVPPNLKDFKVRQSAGPCYAVPAVSMDNN
jgi:large subunit ribosomal protein L41